MPVTAYARLPPALTAPLPGPPPPPRNCFHKDGRPAVCALDGLLHQVRWEAVKDRANEDRASAGKLSAGAVLTPRDGRGTP